MKPILQKWIDYATSDLEVAGVLFKNGEKLGSAYQVCVYHCHQAIEKMLKAHLIKQSKPVIRIHDLIWLEEKTDLEIPMELHQFIRDLNPHYQVARYPDLPFTSNFIFSYKKITTLDILNKTKQLFLWLKEKLVQN
jgi:HEPN domain-containing protein